MPNDTVIKLIQPGTFNDQLTDVLRNGARALLAQAVEAEVADFLSTHDPPEDSNQLSALRSRARPRDRRDITVPIGVPVISAISL